MKAQIEKIELAAASQREKYIDRGLALAYFEEFMRWDKEYLDRMVNRIVSDLNKRFKNKDAAITKKITAILQKQVDDALTMARREIERFRRETEPRHEKNEK
jgi:DNA-directed RNA polymerase subunit F